MAASWEVLQSLDSDHSQALEKAVMHGQLGMLDAQMRLLGFAGQAI